MLDTIKNYFDLYSSERTEPEIESLRAEGPERRPDVPLKRDLTGAEPPAQPSPWGPHGPETRSSTSAELTKIFVPPPAPQAPIPSAKKTVPAATNFRKRRRSPWAAVGQWIALFAGVVIQPFFQNYQSSHEWIWTGITGWTLFAVITSFVIFPAIYKNAFDPDKPVMVQL